LLSARWSKEFLLATAGVFKVMKMRKTITRIGPRHLTPLVLLLMSASFFGSTSEPFRVPFGKWTRVVDKPIVFPQGSSFESAGTFNPSVVMYDGEFVMLYRAQDRKGKSSLGYATSEDGVHFTRRQEPVFVSEAPYEKGGGVEDPRLVKIGDTFYLTYTSYNNVDDHEADKGNAQLCLATSKDLSHWQREGILIPSYQGRWNVKWTKSGAILTEKINGKYWMYFLGDAKGKDTQMGIAYSDDLVHWTEALDHPVLESRLGMFDSQVVEPGPPPILTPEGIFLIYNGADDRKVYSTGWVLFDKNDPTKVIARAATPIFSPEENWEKVGQVPNVVFVEGLVRQSGRWLFYYGGADKYVGVASAPAK
jgi:beta-1,2-mannosidase